MLVEAVVPSGKGTGPGDGTVADFCHVGDGNKRSNKLICNTQPHLWQWINSVSCYLKIDDNVLFQELVRDVFFQFLDNRLRDEPRDDEGARTNYSQHHGTVSELVVICKLLSKLLHNFQCHFMWPVKLGNHLLEFF